MVAIFTRADLQNSYRWDGDPDLAESLDSDLDAAEGHHVLAFINSFLRRMKTTGGHELTFEDGLRIERLLAKRPEGLQSRRKTERWVIDNWWSA